MKKIILSLLFCFSVCSIVLANPITGLLERIDKDASEKFIIELIEEEEDFFELDQAGTKVVVRGNNYVNIATGINWYLKYYANIHLCWNSMRAHLPGSLPPVRVKERRSPSVEYRYNFDYPAFAYSTVFWSWERWQREIDWMALHGINMPLALTGAETVWKRTLLKLGYSREEVDDFITGPCYLPWFLSGDMYSWGGPLPDSWYATQSVLQQNILQRMREYGMKPVLPGFTGMVPSEHIPKYPVKTYALQKWAGYKRPVFIDPTDPKFEEIAEIYYKEQEILYGKADFYSVDILRHDNRFSGFGFQAAGEAILRTIKSVNPQASWVIRASQDNPREDMIRNLPAGDVMILDLYCETQPRWSNSSYYAAETGFGQHDWVYCMKLNFGGNVGLHGKMDHIINDYYAALRSSAGEKMKGIGLTYEGIENNPVMYELFLELPWRNMFSKEEWLETYIKARYGTQNAALEKVWELLSNSIYACPPSSQQQGTSESVFCSRPGEYVYGVSSWSQMRRYYDPDQVIEAAGIMIALADEFAGNNNFEYDLVDILRQAVAEEGRKLYEAAITAYWKGDKTGFRHYSSRFLDALLCQDRLLGTRREFMVGGWLRRAVRKGNTIRERELYEWNARTILTTWGDRRAANEVGLRDYGHKEWNGMLKDYYYPRWDRYFKVLNARLDGVKPGPIDYYAMEETWTREKKFYPPFPRQKEVILVAKEVFERLFLRPAEK